MPLHIYNVTRSLLRWRKEFYGDGPVKFVLQPNESRVVNLWYQD